ncbi:hypothetical protein [Sphingomonas solaris]|uniref:Tetratricopeptide repeat protein n=1 Tax=Alterirhizorhabdus solaris TaxID=2529389 RepID=A0A558QRV1_9SPHN|nr:hypothetical protein [Sphingomonas solaris]TVV69868.1 hypothetical protein FOY91_20570 [Sphingomonas solaris]
MSRWWIGIVAVFVALGGSSAAFAASPRDMLTAAAFQARDKSGALAQIAAAQAAAEADLRARPGDREATLVRAMAIGYRAKLTRNKADALAARKVFEALAAADPRDPQAQMVLAGWHLDSIQDVGRMLAGAVLGAKSATGLAALDRSVALGGAAHATYPGIAALMRIRLDSSDVARARQLAEQAVQAPAVTPLDRVIQRNAAALLVPLRAGDGRAASVLAVKLLPFARIG